MRRRLIAFALATGTVLLPTISVRAQRQAPRVFVLDQEARTITALDAASGALLQTASLQGTPTMLLRTADGKRLNALDRGVGRDAGENGFQAKSKSAATVIDAATLTVGSRVELGWGLERTAMLSAAGDRLVVICPGFTSRKPEETLPRELVTVDLNTGQIAGRIPLPRPATAFFSTPDARTAVVLSARDKPKQTPALPAELRFIDLVGSKDLGTLSIDGNPQTPVLSPDGKFVYLLDRGNPSDNPDKIVKARVHIVSIDARKIETTTEAGSNRRGFVLDETGRQLLLLSDSPPAKGVRNQDRPGELRILRGATVVGPIKVPPFPAFVRPAAGNRVLVIGLNETAGFALPDFTPVTSARTPGIHVSPFATSPDGRRAFIVSNQNLHTYDLESGQELGKVTTGRWSERILLGAIAATATVASQSSGRREAERKGRSWYQYTEYNLRDADETMAVRPDSKAVYVLNQQTSDVTIIDSQTGTLIEKVGADGSSIHFLPGAGVALVVAASAVHAIDLTTNKKLEDLATSPGASFDSVEVSPDGKRAVVYGRGAVAVINGSSGKPQTQLRTFKSIAGVTVEW